jgi:hypothetical protein
MKVRMMLAAAVLGVVACGGPAARACQPAQETAAVTEQQKAAEPVVKDGELVFSMDHADLVVSMHLTVNGSAHVVITSTQVDRTSGDVTLAYTVVQNADQLLRCQKQIELTWRVTDPLKGTEKFKAAGTVMMLNTAAIKQFGEEFLKMVGEEVAG